MESFRRWLYILIAVVMIGAAVLLIVVRKENGDRSVSVVSGTDTYTGELNGLAVEAGACEIEIRTGESGQATVEYENVKSAAYSVLYENGVLKVKYVPKSSWNIRFFDFDSHGRERLILTIPKDALFDKVSMKFGAAEITAEQICAKELELEVGAGEMYAGYLYAEESARLMVGAGALYADRVCLTDANLNCGVGELELSGEIYGNSVAECGVGEIDIMLTTGENMYHGRLDCGLGTITFGQNSVEGSGKKEYGTSSAENRMDIKCGVGEVDVQFH